MKLDSVSTLDDGTFELIVTCDDVSDLASALSVFAAEKRTSNVGGGVTPCAIIEETHNVKLKKPRKKYKKRKPVLDKLEKFDKLEGEMCPRKRCGKGPFHPTGLKVHMRRIHGVGA